MKKQIHMNEWLSAIQVSRQLGKTYFDPEAEPEWKSIQDLRKIFKLSPHQTWCVVDKLRQAGLVARKKVLFRNATGGNGGFVYKITDRYKKLISSGKWLSTLK